MSETSGTSKDVARTLDWWITLKTRMHYSSLMP